MSPKWLRPTGTEKESGQRTYVSGQEYTRQMRTLTDRSALNEAPFHLSEFKKPYASDNSYEEMEHFFSWPSGHQFGFDWPPEEWVKGGEKPDPKLPMKWNPFIATATIDPGSTEPVGVVRNDGKCTWLLNLAGLTDGTVTKQPFNWPYTYPHTHTFDACNLTPSMNAAGSFIVVVKDKTTTLRKTILVGELPMAMVIKAAPFYTGDYSYYKITDLKAGQRVPYAGIMDALNGGIDNLDVEKVYYSDDTHIESTIRIRRYNFTTLAWYTALEENGIAYLSPKSGEYLFTPHNTPGAYNGRFELHSQDYATNVVTVRSFWSGPRYPLPLIELPGTYTYSYVEGADEGFFYIDLPFFRSGTCWGTPAFGGQEPAPKWFTSTEDITLPAENDYCAIGRVTNGSAFTKYRLVGKCLGEEFDIELPYADFADGGIGMIASVHYGRPYLT